MPKVLIATGGTGGHVFPALALASELEEKGVDVLMGGAKLSSSPFLRGHSVPLKDIRSGKNFREIFALGRGLYESVKLLRTFAPELIVGFGSYYSFPILAAGALCGVPILLWAADSIPGKVIRWFSPWAQLTALQFPVAAEHLKGKTTVCSMPLRQALKRVARKEALSRYGLEGRKPVCLVFGGSQGAKFLNRIAPLALTGFEVIHFSGNPEETPLLKGSYEALGIAAAVRDFEAEMQYAWSASDVVCMRAGALSIAELLEFEVPALLIPFPYASENHQEINADFAVSLGIASKSLESQMSPDALSRALRSLLQTGQERIDKLKAYKALEKRATLGELVMESLA